MEAAIKYALQAQDNGEVPIGAVLVNRETGNIVSAAGNLTIQNNDPTAHAEINVIRARCAELGTQRIPGHDLYVTLEPCPMCAAAISNARIDRVFFGAYDPKGGGVDHGAKIFTHPQCNHKPEVIGGVMEQTCASVLKEYFKGKR
jgi:tRNA(Arg) A34 adenosine deaminase TadA